MLSSHIQHQDQVSSLFNEKFYYSRSTLRNKCKAYVRMSSEFRGKKVSSSSTRSSESDNSLYLGSFVSNHASAQTKLLTFISDVEGDAG